MGAWVDHNRPYVVMIALVGLWLIASLFAWVFFIRHERKKRLYEVPQRAERWHKFKVNAGWTAEGDNVTRFDALVLRFVEKEIALHNKVKGKPHGQKTG